MVRTVLSVPSIRPLAAILTLVSLAHAAPSFRVDLAERSMVWIATPTTSDGKQSFTTCGAVVVDAKAGLAVTPFQCVPGEEIPRCAAADGVDQGRVVAFPALRAWPGRCAVVHRDPKLGLAIVRTPGKGHVAATLAKSAPQRGQPTWSIGFPHQVPSFVSRGSVAALPISGLPLTGLAAKLETPLLLITGASTHGSAGSGVFDQQGALLGIVVADLNALDGAAAVPSSAIERALLNAR